MPANPDTTAPKWTPAGEMPAMPRAWYWADFPGGWIFYAPERNAALGIDHGNTGWNPLLSKRYWGPWSEQTLAALQQEKAHA